MRDYETEKTMSYEEYLEYKKTQKEEPKHMKESAKEIVVQETELEEVNEEVNEEVEPFETEDTSNEMKTGVIIYENKVGRISYEFIGEVTLEKAIFYREFYSRVVDEIWDKQTEV